jgi:hypothetical protein
MVNDVRLLSIIEISISPFFQVTMRQRFTENATDVLGKHIQLFGATNTPDFGCNFFVAP